MPEAALRDAATLILLRKTAGTTEVLLGRRGAGHRFMPNVLVFPGGAVDAGDFTAPVAAPLRPDTKARLERSASPALATALAHAAARELAEETGLNLGLPPNLAVLDYLCRAETPPAYETRFNARFFLAEASDSAGTLTDSAEMEDLGWHDIAASLPVTIARPTALVLHLLKRHLAGDVLITADAPVPVLRHRQWAQE
jgi:8-oxo-dGTP pyrophosphatase MutT (NUDIX family)